MSSSLPSATAFAEPTDTSIDASVREDELEALRSIYDSALTTPRPNTLVLSLPISPPSPLRLALPGPQFLQSRVPHLPPAVLTVAFPSKYPSAAPPRLHLSIPYATLPQLKDLADILGEMFVVGEPVVFEWASAVEEYVLEQVLTREEPKGQAGGQEASGSDGRTESGYWLQLSDDPALAPNDKRVARPRRDAQTVARSIQSFAIRAERARVDAGYVKCPACWEQMSGTKCTSLSACRHVACNECLAGFWGARIAEGRVHTKDIVCAESDCSAPAHPTEVRQVLDAETYEKYELFLLNRALEVDDEMVHCAREGCSQIAGVDVDEPNLGRCAYCLYVFCIACRKKWHAPMSCESDHAEEVDVEALMWQLESVTSEELVQMRSERNADDWAKVETGMALCKLGGKVCPDCKMLVIKDGGCSHMTCMCGCEFCWACLEKLDGVMNHYAPGACLMYNDIEMQAIHEQVWNYIYDGEVFM